MIKIIYEDNHLLVVEKPRNMLVQSDITKDKDMLTELKAYLKEKYHKTGNVYLGLVHRLDRPVGGVMVFAKTSKAAERLSKSIQTNEMHKTYLAWICGYLDKPKDILTDNLLKIPNENKTIVSPQGKPSSLEYEVLTEVDNLTLVKINLITGRSHQIRVQFSSRNLPLWGDNRYNSNAHPGEQIALWAYELTLPHPITKEIMTFKCLPKNTEYPWNLLAFK